MQCFFQSKFKVGDISFQSKSSETGLLILRGHFKVGDISFQGKSSERNLSFLCGHFKVRAQETRATKLAGECFHKFALKW